MADTNPLDDLFRTDTDVNAVNELVASLESKLASPTINDHSLSISTPSVNCNHAIGTTTNSACTNVLITAQNNNVQLTNNTGSIHNAVSKKDNQILGINSIHSNSPITIVNSPANSQRTVSPKPLNSVNKPASPSIQVISQAQNQGNQTLVGNVHQINSATPPLSQSLPTNSLCQVTTNVKLIPNSSTLTSSSSAIVLQSDNSSGNLNRSSPGIINANVHGSVKSTQGIVVNSVASQPTQKTNVHIVHNVSSNATQAIPTQSVITVRGQAPVSQMSNARPQVVTSHNNASSPRPQGNVRIQQTRMQTAPIRIASTQPNQINIAPRPGGPPGTITLPPGLVHSQGAVLMKNEHGQIVIVQPGNLPHQPVSTVTISSSSTPQKVQYVRHPNTTQRLPSGQILTIQPGQSQPQMIVRQAVPAPINTAKQQPGVRVSLPQNIQTVVRTSAPSLPPSQTAPSGGQTSSGPAAVQHQQMMENVKKCKNFLSTLIKLAASQPEATVSSVRDLIQGLIDGKLEPEVFTERLQKELKSSPQPYLVPFLKKSLPLLRQSLLNNKMTIDGVRPPPVEIVQHQAPVNIVPASQPSVQQTVMKGAQPGPAQPKSRVPQLMTQNRKAVLSKQVHQAGGNVPSTVKAFQHKVTGVSASSSPGPSHSQKEKKKFETLKDDDDINDVATMGGVNLTEESRNILATNADFIGTQIRSCKDESFLFHGALLSRITAIAKKHGLNEVPGEVVNLVSHATQERLREIVEKLSVIAEQRSEIYKINEKFEASTDVKAQLKFLEELDVLERKRHEEQEKEMLRRAAKSRTKHEDPEHLKLKQRAKDLQQAEMEEVRQREANLTALAAIGPRKKRKLDSDASGSSSGSGITNGPATSARSSLRPRIKRVNLRDLLFLMEQDKTLDKSNLLYRTFLK